MYFTIYYKTIVPGTWFVRNSKDSSFPIESLAFSSMYNVAKHQLIRWLKIVKELNLLL